MRSRMTRISASRFGAHTSCIRDMAVGGSDNDDDEWPTLQADAGEDGGGNEPKGGDHSVRFGLRSTAMADDAPVTFKRKQSKPSHSSRARPIEDPVVAGMEDGAAQKSGDSSPAAIASRLRKQQKARQKQKTQLSFGGDDEVRVSDSPYDPMLMFLFVRAG